MNIRSKLASSATVVAAASLFAAAGVTRGQEIISAYVVDDSAITAAVKTRLADDKDTAESASSSFSVETLNGEVRLSGFAKSANERAIAENLALKVNGVKLVRNRIVVQQ